MTGQTVRDTGEFGLIARLRDSLPAAVKTGPALTLGIGDDAAVWRPPAAAAVVVTTDSLVEGIHFRLDWTDWTSLGHKTLAVNLSDIAAMGAKPALATITLGLRGSERIDDLLQLYQGLGNFAARTGTLIAGGDIVASPQALTLHVTLLGAAAHGRMLTRSGAQPGDLIAVSGTLGASAAGLALLAMPPGDPARTATTADLLIAAHLRPEPRLALGELLLQHGASAAMDLSDGLLGDLPKLLDASDVAAEIEAGSLPVAAAVHALFPDRWRELALRGGEDYELLFTLPPAGFADLVAAASAIDTTVTAIGTILPREDTSPLITMRHPDGRIEAIDPGAFDHFV